MFELIAETDFTAYRCCVCGWRVEVLDSDFSTSSVCKTCDSIFDSIAYIPIPWQDWTGDLDASPPTVNVRNRLRPWS